MSGEGRADLTGVPTSALERVREGLVRRDLTTPITRASLLAFGVSHQLDALEGALGGHPLLACIGMIEVVLAERKKAVRPAPELVWTGPERSRSTARDTAVVLPALFESAEEQVILAGFSFARGSTVLEPLHRVMRGRRLDVRFFVHVAQMEGAGDAAAHVDAQLSKFLRDAWPFGDPVPHLYYDKRALVPGPPWSSLHAKCVVVDGARAFVSSANFSLRAQEHNIEAGVLLDDRAFAHHLARQWLGLVEADLVAEWTPSAR
jgi:phosphatidylserine/phosphatidylglycerophosphate/cardiolipin synthase-like enzyme